MHKLFTFALGTALLLAIPLRGTLISFTEVGDAGNTLPGAQVVYGSGQLDQIVGHLNAPGDTTGAVDLFEIYVTDPQNFSALTSGGAPDPELALFDINGRGLEMGRDIDLAGGNKQGFLIGDSSGTVPPQPVYLWISLQDRDPGCAGGTPMFEAAPSGTQSPNVAGTLSNCTLTGPNGNVNAANLVAGNYAYTITLTGASFVPVPEPASVFFVALGLVAFATRRRRR